MIPVTKQALGWVEDDGTEYEPELVLLGLVQRRIFPAAAVSFNMNGKAAVLEHSAPIGMMADKPVTRIVVET